MHAALGPFHPPGEVQHHPGVQPGQLHIPGEQLCLLDIAVAEGKGGLPVQPAPDGRAGHQRGGTDQQVLLLPQGVRRQGARPSLYWALKEHLNFVHPPVLHAGEHLLLQLQGVMDLLLPPLGRGRLLGGGQFLLRQQQLAHVQLFPVEEVVHRAQDLQKIPQRIGRDGGEIVRQLPGPPDVLPHGAQDAHGQRMVYRAVGHRADDQRHRPPLRPEQAVVQEILVHVIAHVPGSGEDMAFLQNRQIRLEPGVVIQSGEFPVPVQPHGQPRQRGQRCRQVFVVNAHMPHLSKFCEDYTISETDVQDTGSVALYNSHKSGAAPAPKRGRFL